MSSSSSSSSSSSPWILGSLLIAGVVGLVALAAHHDEEPKKRKSRKSKTKAEPDDSESTELFQIRSVSCREALVKGDQYIRAGKLDLAEKLYTREIKQLGDNEEVAAFYYQRGCLLLHKKRYRSASEDGTCVIKLKPRLPHGYQLRAFALLNLDHLEDTALDYEKAVELEKTLETKHRKHVRRKDGLSVPNLWTHREIQEEDETEKNPEERSEEEECDLTTSISSLSSVSSTSSTRTKKKRVSFLEQTGNVPVETIPGAKIMLVSVIASLGSRCLSVGQHARAVEYLRRTQELAPRDYGNWVINAQISQCYLSLGEGENALMFAKKVVNLKADDPRGYYMSGEALLLLNRHVEAAETFEKALQLNPKYGEAKRKLAQAKSLAKGEEKRIRS